VRFDTKSGLQDEQQDKLSTDSIWTSLSGLQQDNLFGLILFRPGVIINTNQPHTQFYYDQVPLQPRANLTFARDQQITTAKGVVIERFAAIEHHPVNQLKSAVWPQSGVHPIGTIQPPGTLEGGDFIAVSKDLAMLGTSLRINFFAARQFMDEDLVGTH
jgi:arginine deiminase